MQNDILKKYTSTEQKARKLENRMKNKAIRRKPKKKRRKKSISLQKQSATNIRQIKNVRSCHSNLEI